MNKNTISKIKTKTQISNNSFFSFLIIALCLILSLCACGNESNSSSEKSSESIPETVSEFSEEQLINYDLFARHGLSEIIPKKYFKCALVAETPEEASTLLTEYEFTVFAETDDELERQSYYNQIINAIKSVSSDENVYKNSENGLSMLSVYEDRVPSSEKMVCYFKMKKGDETKLYKLTAEDRASTGLHLYSLSLTYSDIEF